MGQVGWINDPNGFIQYKDKYHLFYQHYPYDAVWGPMHWGHAVSNDMIKWSYLPMALAPEEEYDKDGCFSGSAIEKDGILYLMYTGHAYEGMDKGRDYLQTQCIAYSYDGVVFQKHKHNPVIEKSILPADASCRDFRDPRVFKAGSCYYAVIGSKDNYNNGQVLLYKSQDLLNWKYVNCPAKSSGNIGETWECPELFRLENKDVLIVSPQYLKANGNDYNNLHSTIYMTGQLSLEEGLFEFNQYLPVDYGFDFYAPQTMLDSKGRRIIIGWMDMWETPKPTQLNKHNWAGAMTLPREIVLSGDRLCFRPIKEIEAYRQNEYSISDYRMNGEEQLDIYGDSYELQVDFEVINAMKFGLKLRVNAVEKTVLYYNVEEGLFHFNRDKSGNAITGERRTNIGLSDNKLKLRIFVDKSSVEVFLNEGEKVMTGRIYPSEDAIKVFAFSEGDCIFTLQKWDIA